MIMHYDRSKYIMDDPREAKRLDAKVKPEEFIQKFLSPVLTPDHQTIVDVGCGAGAILSTLAKQYPYKTFKGVDISGARIAEAKAKCESLTNIDFIETTIYDIPIASHSADVVYIRFLLEYLKEPVRAIAELGRILKPGGRLVMQDLDGQLLFQYPFAVPEIETIFNYLHAKTGFDPYIGRKLYGYALEAGLTYVNMDIQGYHVFPGKIDAYNHDLWNQKLEIFMPQAAEALGSWPAAEAFKNKYMGFLEDEKTFLYSSLFTVYVTK